VIAVVSLAEAILNTVIIVGGTALAIYLFGRGR